MKMHWCTPLLALAAPVLSAPIVAPRSTAGSERAIWLWNSDIIQDDSQVQTFLSLMTDTEHPFQTVLALIDRDMGNAPWQSFIKKCNAAGLKVEALMGDKQWIVGQTSEDGPTLQHELDWIKKYQASASSDAKLAGIHLDVEPWALDGFESNQAEYVSSLVSIVSQVKQVAQPLNLPLGADLPFWANTVACEDSTLDTCLLNNLDYVTFMTYRNTAKSLLGIADPVLKAVKAVDSSKPVWLSVETSSECSDVSLISYAGKTLNTMLSDLVTVATSAEKSSGNFAGVAVHSYKDFLTMSG
ncbi:hypothetical protein SLS60_003997 [Paraconiothyrium brasiliense]|uniref:Uncharacterized protein n=1 Tax=Paraconiothyrium brasiliense TaxID=300254 RepID=A0ABR3RQE1_9PLEO